MIMTIKYDNCKNCRSRCIHAGKDRDFVCINGVSCKITTGKSQTNAVTVQKWISVDDELPEEEGWYLVYTTPNREHKSINKAMFCKGYAWGNFESYWRGAGGHWANVTHWMPLPEPPEREKTEE